ncbi:hypothetical protein B0H14DRAFT_2556593 [Mycena olivaceomarginata]|nr:hypothetical protein B0H14DRAFT_2556593 [Mycena olivaceomarginata]
MGRINNKIHVFVTINIKCQARGVVLTRRQLESWIYGAIYLAKSGYGSYDRPTGISPLQRGREAPFPVRPVLPREHHTRGEPGDDRAVPRVFALSGRGHGGGKRFGRGAAAAASGRGVTSTIVTVESEESGNIATTAMHESRSNLVKLFGYLAFERSE